MSRKAKVQSMAMAKEMEEVLQMIVEVLKGHAERLNRLEKFRPSGGAAPSTSNPPSSSNSWMVKAIFTNTQAILKLLEKKSGGEKP